MEKVVLEGKKYFGRFQAESKDESYMFRGDTHDRHSYWWEGQCAIKELDTDDEQKCLFTSKRDGRFTGSLEKAVLSFTSRYVSYPDRPEIQDYAAVVDMILEQMYKTAKEQLANPETIIPTVIAPSLDVEELCAMFFAKKR